MKSILKGLIGVFLCMAGGEASPRDSYALVIKKALPAVVNIYATQVVEEPVFGGLLTDPLMEQLFGGGATRQALASSLGSGVMIRKDGIIITCLHVVRNAKAIKVRLSNGVVANAEVVARDAHNDLAALKITSPPDASPLPVLELGESDTLEVGDKVFAIGNPFGIGQMVVAGIISSEATVIQGRRLIGTDAAINPGNSGGALIDSNGLLIGIPNAILSKTGASTGIGFAIPAKLVKAVVDSIGKDEGKAHVLRPWSGVRVQEMNAAMAESLGIPEPKGVIVSYIHSLSPAQSGLAKGDIILSVNGKDVRDEADFHDKIQSANLDETVTFQVRKPDKAIQAVDVKLISPPQVPAPHRTEIKGKNILSGVIVDMLSPALAMELGLDSTLEGLVVLDISRNPANGFIGLQPGDILLTMNEKKIENIKILLTELEKKQIDMTVKRGENLLNFSLSFQ